MSCKVVTGSKRTLLIFAYLPPSTLDHLLYLEEFLTRFQDQDHILLGYLNANIAQAQNPCSRQVADLMM